MAVKKRKKKEELADRKQGYVNGKVYLDFELSKPAGSKALIEVLKQYVAEEGDTILKEETKEYQRQAAALKDIFFKVGKGI